MRFLRGLLRALLGTLAALLLAFAAYAGYAHWAWRDIPAADIEARYGAGALTAIADGVPLRYRRDGHGPAVVLIHSHFFDMGIWDAWVPVLAPHFTVLRYDLTGHGLTGPDPSGDYTAGRDIALLDGLLGQLGIASAALVGSSIGGNIAFAYAARHPESVHALVLINSGGLARKPGRSGSDIPGWADWIMPLVPPLALHRFVDWMIADDRAASAAVKARFVDLWRREGNRRAELSRLRQFATDDADALLSSIKAPTLILWGEANPQLPVALAQEFEKKLTHAARVARKTYPGAGHVLPLERPAESAADTLAFLKATP